MVSYLNPTLWRKPWQIFQSPPVKWMTWITDEAILSVHRQDKVMMQIQKGSSRKQSRRMLKEKQSWRAKKSLGHLRNEILITRIISVKRCLDTPRWKTTGDEIWPCRPLAQKPPKCWKHGLWLWQALEMPDKGHEPSPWHSLGGLEKPGCT